MVAPTQRRSCDASGVGLQLVRETPRPTVELRTYYLLLYHSVKLYPRSSRCGRTLQQVIALLSGPAIIRGILE
ncbi:hypothetical protein GW17_00042827 [Ensete ventricosum]|nr:hypothetical protein GW17_00042827 [Ensete ventricosum]